MLSTLFSLDPTLTVNNVSHIMDKIEPKGNMQVWNDVLQHEWIQNLSVKEFSFKEEECADIYVNCCHFTSWDHLAKSLYRHHQVAAVEEVRSYLPPRGQPHFGICLYFHYASVIYLWCSHIHVSHSFTTSRVYYYCIAGKFGGELNLVWRSISQLPN